jgi:hypothetical protein
LIFLHGSSKSKAFVQTDYLAQILETYLRLIIEAFAAITHQLRPVAEPLFIENRNSAYSYKSTRNYYAK